MSRATPVQKTDSLVFGNDSQEFYLNTRTGLLSKTLIWVSHFCETLNALKLGAPLQMIRSGDALSNATTGTTEVHWLARAANPCRSWRFLSSTETSSSPRTRLSSLSPKICRLGAPAESYGLLNVFIKSFLTGSEPFRCKGGFVQAIWRRKGTLFILKPAEAIFQQTATERFFMPTLEARRAPWQLGGLPPQETIRL